jgi:hypothetical protein
MKKQIVNIVVSLSIVITLTLSVFAQMGGVVSATIPFAFNINGAGSYNIHRLNTPDLMTIQDSATKKSASFICRQELTPKSDGKSQLVFHRYGNQYFLSEVQDNGATKKLGKSKAERVAARGMTDHLAENIQPEIVTVSMQ